MFSSPSKPGNTLFNMPLPSFASIDRLEFDERRFHHCEGRHFIAYADAIAILIVVAAGDYRVHAGCQRSERTDRRDRIARVLFVATRHGERDIRHQSATEVYGGPGRAGGSRHLPV